MGDRETEKQTQTESRVNGWQGNGYTSTTHPGYVCLQLLYSHTVVHLLVVSPFRLGDCHLQSYMGTISPACLYI